MSRSFFISLFSTFISIISITISIFFTIFSTQILQASYPSSSTSYIQDAPCETKSNAVNSKTVEEACTLQPNWGKTLYKCTNKIEAEKDAELTCTFGQNFEYKIKVGDWDYCSKIVSTTSSSTQSNATITTTPTLVNEWPSCPEGFSNSEDLYLDGNNNSDGRDKCAKFKVTTTTDGKLECPKATYTCPEKIDCTNVDDIAKYIHTCSCKAELPDTFIGVDNVDLKWMYKAASKQYCPNQKEFKLIDSENSCELIKTPANDKKTIQINKFVTIHKSPDSVKGWLKTITKDGNFSVKARSSYKCHDKKIKPNKDKLCELQKIKEKSWPYKPYFEEKKSMVKAKVTPPTGGVVINLDDPLAAEKSAYLAVPSITISKPEKTRPESIPNL